MGRLPLRIGLKDAAAISRQSMLSMELLKKKPPASERPPLRIGLKDAAAISQETLKSPPPRQSMLSMELLKKTPLLEEDHRYELV